MPRLKCVKLGYLANITAFSICRSQPLGHPASTAINWLKFWRKRGHWHPANVEYKFEGCKNANGSHVSAPVAFKFFHQLGCGASVLDTMDRVHVLPVMVWNCHIKNVLDLRVLCPITFSLHLFKWPVSNCTPSCGPVNHFVFMRCILVYWSRACSTLFLRTFLTLYNFINLSPCPSGFFWSVTAHVYRVRYFKFTYKYHHFMCSPIIGPLSFRVSVSCKRPW